MHDIKQKGVWHKVKITDRTHMIINGKRIPTWSMMERLASKI